MVCPVVMYGCENWAIKEAECHRIDPLELWCWRRLYTVNTEIRLIIFFAAKDGEALYSEQKRDEELTVAQITNLYCKIQT